MAVSLHPTTCSYLHTSSSPPQTSLSCGSKVYVGLRLQCPNSYGIEKHNLNVQFYDKVYKSVQSRTCNGKPKRGRLAMMPIGTPRVPYRNVKEGTWQWVDLWNALYRERIIFLGQYIDDEYSNQLLATMLYLDSVEDTNKLYIWISGPGGDLTPSMAVYDTMQSLKSPIATLCMGYAYNMAAFILAAGEKGSRQSMPLSRIALQTPAGAARGQADDIRNEADELIRIKDYLFKELAQHTGQPVEKIHQDLRRVKRFGAQEAIDYGLIDRILRPSSFDPDAPSKESTGGLG